MELNGGVLIIGSLLWDIEEKPLRKEWQKNLFMPSKKLVRLPIRYGRKSSTRANTYSMVFSNQLKETDLGRAYAIPFIDTIESNEQLLAQVKYLARAEGLDPENLGLVFKSWGTVCIAINPFISIEKSTAIHDIWNRLVTSKNEALVRGQVKPRFVNFGEPNEEKSIDVDLKLTINLSDQFKSDLSHFDFLLATSNAILRRDEKLVYPTANEIALAIYEAKDFEYFFKNRSSSICTFQDKIIAKILRLKYNINARNWHKQNLSK